MGEIDGLPLFGVTIFSAREPFQKGGYFNLLPCSAEGGRRGASLVCIRKNEVFVPDSACVLSCLQAITCGIMTL